MNRAIKAEIQRVISAKTFWVSLAPAGGQEVLDKCAWDEDVRADYSRRSSK